MKMPWLALSGEPYHSFMPFCIAASFCLDWFVANTGSRYFMQRRVVAIILWVMECVFPHWDIVQCASRTATLESKPASDIA